MQQIRIEFELGSQVPFSISITQSTHMKSLLDVKSKWLNNFDSCLKRGKTTVIQSVKRTLAYARPVTGSEYLRALLWIKVLLTTA